MIISEGAVKTKMRASEFHFKVQKSWFGGDSTEKIEGWKTRIFEAAGKMVAVTISKVNPSAVLLSLSTNKLTSSHISASIAHSYHTNGNLSYMPGGQAHAQFSLMPQASIKAFKDSGWEIAFHGIFQRYDVDFSALLSSQRATIIPQSSTFEEYLAMDMPKDSVSEEPVDPYSMETSPGKPIKQVHQQDLVY